MAGELWKFDPNEIVENARVSKKKGWIVST